MNEIVLVHQMGKVGSTTILNGLVENDNNNVYHTHFLNHDRLHGQITHSYNKDKLTAHLRNSLAVREILDGQDRNEVKFKVITCVRDPVSRNVSAYFQNLGKKDQWNVDDLVRHFLKTYKHEIPLKWFDWEIRDVFGIDVYTYPFCKEQGWVKIQKNNVELLVLRVENLKELISQGVIQRFVGDGSWLFKSSHNRSSDKEYSLLYEKFKEKICFPHDYLSLMYESEYCSHFYSPREIEDLYSNWRR